MKRIAVFTAALVMLASPAFAGGKSHNQSLNANLNIATTKGGLLGTVLGTVKGKNNGLNVNANVTTTKGGLLGVILGGR